MIRRPPRSTLFPYRRSSDLVPHLKKVDPVLAQVIDKVGIYKGWPDRKSTRLNSSHVRISYAVFCLKKKKKPDMVGCGEVHLNVLLTDKHPKQVGLPCRQACR